MPLSGVLGSLEKQTIYEAEVVGILLAVWMASQERDATSVSIKADSQASVHALRTSRAGPGRYLLEKTHELSTSLRSCNGPRQQLKISWVFDGVAGNERADEEAKAAAVRSSSLEYILPPLLLHSASLPFSIMATKQCFQQNWRRSGERAGLGRPITNMRLK